MFDTAGIDAGQSVIDVGGGASTLVDALLERGHHDVTVLDISTEGIHTAQTRLGPRAPHVRWLVEDLHTWTPDRTWSVWHDRAVLHFFTTQADRQRYPRALEAATTPGSIAIIATFAPEGPEYCSGLPVTRYDPRKLAELLGQHWRPLRHAHQDHATPSNTTQPFTWATFRREQ